MKFIELTLKENGRKVSLNAKMIMVFTDNNNDGTLANFLNGGEEVFIESYEEIKRLLNVKGENEHE